LRDESADKIEANRMVRAENLITCSEQDAGRIAGMAQSSSPAELHLREERIDAIATLLSLFAKSDAAAADPTNWSDEDLALVSRHDNPRPTLLNN
jgi:hypothetical protein